MLKKIENLEVGMVGSGFAAHLRSFSIVKLDSDRVKIIGIYDKDLENSKKFGEEFSLKIFKSFEEMLESNDINTIAVCVPNKFHYGLIKESLKNGKHIICEYPLVVDDYNKAEELFKMADKNNLFIHVGQTMDFDSDLSFVLLHKDKLGKLYMGYKYMTFGKTGSWFSFSGSKEKFNNLGEWYVDRNLTGGWMVTSCYHGIQILRKIFGEVSRVSAVDSSDGKVGAGSVILEHLDGSSSVVQWGLSILGKTFNTLIITGSEGSVEIDEGKYLIHTSEFKGSGSLQEKDTFYDDSKLLLDKINGIADFDKSNNDMLMNLKISLLAQKSANEGREFKIQ
ncbi:MAG: Gfo/Idh/MocA family oxidoreductase [Actinobacteria bacterium]|nr:Gfo/Idh/MocA family oxidoreductase [Actinomycetota bacterium]